LKMNIEKAIEIYQLRSQNRKLIADLRDANLTLEQKIIERTQKIELQNREITCSIQYASRIQNALLYPSTDFERLFHSYFILNKPKDIVSGDFYWTAIKDEKALVAVADCTGHGVPGAFMSILGITFLNEIVNKTVALRANEILNHLRGQIMKSLHQTGKCDETRDGMEMALCIIDFHKMRLEFSGAFRPLYLLRNGEITELNGDNMPIGIYEDEEISFTAKEIQFEKDDVIYMFTDGYLHQMGGDNRKTFKSQNFKKMLIDIHTFPLQKQKELLGGKLIEWQGDLEQVDDILVVGIKL
jgi:serine phosphatase RsbU (regulator of sigma subunit)